MMWAMPDAKSLEIYIVHRPVSGVPKAPQIQAQKPLRLLFIDFQLPAGRCSLITETVDTRTI